VTPQRARWSLREWIRRVWGALSGRRTDDDLQRELAGHVALAEDALRRKGHAPGDAARLARACAAGNIQALEALREQRGLSWLGSSWLDVRLGLRLLVKNWRADAGRCHHRRGHRPPAAALGRRPLCADGVHGRTTPA
jgi:hypothetical protein